MAEKLEIVQEMLRGAQARREALEAVRDRLPESEYQRRLELCDEQIAAYVLQISDIRDRAAEASVAATEAKARLVEDQVAQESAFWFRRFFTTLGIGNAAAFAAIASGFLQADNRTEIAEPAANALTYFSAGMMSAGILPLLIWLRLETRRVSLGDLADPASTEFVQWSIRSLLTLTSWISTILSAIFLVVGFGFAIGGVRGLITPG